MWKTQNIKEMGIMPKSEEKVGYIFAHFPARRAAPEIFCYLNMPRRGWAPNA